jgi:hypothetical protein
MISSNVLVKQDKNKFFWEINHSSRKAFRRDIKYLNSAPLDFSEQYNTIIEFIKGELKYPYVKELIEGQKIIFTKEKPFCSYSVTGLDRYNPASIWHCDNIASVKLENKPLCINHARLKI